MSEGKSNPEIPSASPTSVRIRGRRPLHLRNRSPNNLSHSIESSTDFLLNESNSSEYDTSRPHKEDSREENDDRNEDSRSDISEDEKGLTESDESKDETEAPPKHFVVPEPCRVKADRSQNFLDFIKQYQIIPAIVVCVLIGLVIASTSNLQESFNIQKLKEEHPQQDDFLWIAFESGVNDVITRNRPSTFILMYQNDATLDKLVNGLAKYAACSITDCSKEPITITNSIINSREMIRDYGNMITRYKDKLKEQGVMIIKNLENVQGVSAQAFHSFCDEFTPLIERSLFIFTMKVDKLHGDNKMKFLEDYFRNKWSDLKSDTFNALITRISSMVIEIVP